MNGSLLGGLGGQGSAARERYPSPACWIQATGRKAIKLTVRVREAPRVARKPVLWPPSNQQQAGTVGTRPVSGPRFPPTATVGTRSLPGLEGPGNNGAEVSYPERTWSP